jgi:hypothetical protein
VDLAGAELLLELHATLLERRVDFRLAETRGQVRAALGRLGSTRAAVLVEEHQTVDDVVSRWQSERPAA